MKTEAEFYLSEYQKSDKLYAECPIKERRRKKLYDYLRKSMQEAYIEALSRQKGQPR